MKLLQAATIVLSAFLLFQIQPILARLLLPWFGGAAAVWTTCLVFFQSVLLAGYLYAHWTVRSLSAPRQAWLHLGLVGASLTALPIGFDAAWQPDGSEHAAGRLLLILVVNAGLPYFLLSSTSPLVQAWYAEAGLGAIPYRLFALSNLGSLAALVSYPFLIEPWIGTARQAALFSGAYGLYAAGLAALAAGRIVARPHRAAVGAPVDQAMASRTDAPRPERCVAWMALAACPSVLLLALTSHLTQDVAPIPLLWILPLALYLLSFALCFDARRWYRRGLFLALLAPALGLMTWLLGDGSRLDLRALVAIHAAAFFVCCMVCHGELARQAPPARHLTTFYLTIGAGGAAGGAFVGLVAPAIFRSYLELPIAIAFAAVLAVAVVLLDPGATLPRRASPVVRAAAVAGLAMLCLALGRTIRETTNGYRVVDRNFYGALRISEPADPGRPGATRKLLHGAITHGLQPLAPDLRRAPSSYYCADSGAGVAILQRTSAAQRVGAIGLGVGTIASYGRLGDTYRFYEINPLVAALARSQFSYLSESAAAIDVVPGDGRLSLSRESPQQYDVLVVDAFSGDAIPVHLLTFEAFELYLRHLTPTGILALHVSNRYVELEPVVAGAAAALGRPAAVVSSDDDEPICYGSTWVLVGNSPRSLQQPAIRSVSRPATAPPGLAPWTDDHANVLAALK